MAAVGLVLAVWLPFERTLPHNVDTWDAWAIWLFKAQAFYIDGNFSGYFSRASEFVGQPGYPLLTPLYGVWLYDWAGGVFDQAAKLTSPCYFLATVGVVWHVARRLAGSTIAGIAAALTALTPMVQLTAFQWAGYSDTALSAYLVAASGFLVLWMRDGEVQHLAAGSLAATAAAWTKNEGLVALSVFVVLALATAVVRRAGAASWAWVLSPPGILLGLWYFVRESYGLDAADFAPGAAFQPELFTISATRLAEKALAPGRFALAFPLFAAALFRAAWTRQPITRLSPAVFVFAHLAAALLAYSTGRNEIEWWLETSGDRVVAQIAPLAVLAAAIAVSGTPNPIETQADDARGRGRIEKSVVGRRRGRSR